MKRQERQTGADRDLGRERGTIRIGLRREGRENPDFVPLGPPDAYDLDLEPLLRGGLDPLVDELVLDAQVALAAGVYHLPIIADQPLDVELPENLSAQVHIEVGPVSGTRSSGSQEDLPGVGIQAFEVQFEPAVRLPNVFDVLYKLPGLFVDHDVEAAKRLAFQLLQSNVAQNLVQVGQEWFTWLEESVDLVSPKAGKAAWSLLGLAEMIRSEVTRVGQKWKQKGFDLFEEFSRLKERLPVIYLERAKAQPVLDEEGRAHLDFRFSGESHLKNGRTWRFEDVLLPHMILPAPHALISDLISERPLATAVVREGAFSLRRFMESLVEAPTSVSGTLVGRGSLPVVEVGGQTPDLGEYRTTFRIGGKGRLDGRFDLRASRDALHIETLQLDYAKEDRGLGLTMTGSVELRPSEEDILDGSSDPGKRPLEESSGDRANSRSVLDRCVAAAFERRWAEDLHFQTGWNLVTKGALDDLEVGAHWAHQLLDGSMQAMLVFDEVRVSGELALEGQGSPVRIEVQQGAGLDFKAEGRLEQAVARLGGMLVRPAMSDMSIRSKVGRAQGGGLSFVTDLGADLAVQVVYGLELFPEFGIDQDDEAVFEGQGRISGRFLVETSSLQGREMTARFDDSAFDILVAHLSGDIAGRRLLFPAGSTLDFKFLEAQMATSGLGRASIQLGWDLAGQSPMLSFGDRTAELFVEDLRRGTLVMHVSEAGGVTFSGLEGGLYDFHFFNALVNPGDEPRRWLEILSDDEAMDRVEATVEFFSRDVAAFLRSGRKQVRRIRRILEEENIERAADLVPAHRMARVLSKVICDEDSEEKTIESLVRAVVAGQGLDVPQVRALIDRYYPDHEYDFEIERTLRILARLLAPTEPVPEMAPLEEQPLSERDDYQRLFSGYLSAGSVYERLSRPEAQDPEFWITLGRQAPYLTIEQLDHILACLDETSPPDQVRRLRAVRALKARTRLIADAYGGIAFMPQAWAVGLFLGEAVRAGGVAVGGAAQGRCRPVARDRFELGQSLLGPADVAVLLHAGLASFWQGPAVQTNQRLLLDLICSQPGEFLLGVLWEMAHRSPRALSGVLYGLLQIEQGALLDQVDMPSLLSSILGIEVPRIDDYMAGGRRARQSLFEALNDTAKQILDAAEPYVALREYLQVQRRRPPQVAAVPESAAALADKAQRAIVRADKAGAACKFPKPDPKKVAAAGRAYRRAFEACRSLLSAAPTAFQEDWFRSFFARNYEALMVRSLVRNHQNAIDDVPAWLEKRLGAKVPRDEQELVDAVIDVLYYFEEDRTKLKSDPLVRLLLDPPAGRYDLTIVSCMGVITEGARGTELEDAYRRLGEQLGIRVIRADTQTARTLEYNAARVEEAVRRVDGPWGYVGYSQGCANGLMAEARMLGGSPEQQELVSRLKTRHLLFSALNGSAHGTCGDWKFLRAMSDADRFLKFYQALLSRSAIRFSLKNLRALLDSKPFVHSLGGVASLSHEGVRALARDGQFRADVPTTILRGIVEPETTPEVLEMLSNWLTKEVESDQHDTQVTFWEAVGHPVWVRNEQSRSLARCDMGGLVQRTHHWSPLVHAVKFVTTDRDQALGIYDTPKDRHVFPWVEVNARFGIIDVIASGD